VHDVALVKQPTELFYVEIHSMSLLNFHTVSTADHIRLLELQRRASFPNSRYYRLRISEHGRWLNQLIGFHLVKGIFCTERTSCYELTMLPETARFQRLNALPNSDEICDERYDTITR
jgi:hypothetical protein